MTNSERGHAIAQAVSRRRLAAKGRVRSQFSPCWIFGGQSGTATGFSLSLSVSPVNIIPPLLIFAHVSSGG
jgi:hypothetical protein